MSLADNGQAPHRVPKGPTLRVHSHQLSPNEERTDPPKITPAQLFHDCKQCGERSHMTDAQLASTQAIDCWWRKVLREFILRIGHQAWKGAVTFPGRVFIPIQEQINRHVAIPLEFDIMGVECRTVVRTDSRQQPSLRATLTFAAIHHPRLHECGLSPTRPRHE